jgi:hypothetical protein
MFDILWDTALEYGIDPPGMIAQAGKETKWGEYSGNVPWWFFNTAGIKVKQDKLVMSMLGTLDPDHPLVHQQFPNWYVGASAHARHLWAYCNYDQPDKINVDPRWDWVYGKHNVVTWSDLDGRKWAGETYGTELQRIIDRLRGTV